MEFDPLLLSRLQFALTIMFHYLFPPLSIGLGVLMVFMEGAYLRTGDPQYQAMTKFWTKVFAVNFAVGVASGIVMQFQFGTNWSRYSRYVGDVFGSALAAEGVFAFFLESGFLAVLVFGWDRVSPRVHFFSTCMVALGSVFSAVWIVIANSWQQTPAGSHVVTDPVTGFSRAEIVDFWAVLFNPSSMQRLTHVLLGAFLQGAFFVLSVCAYYVLKGRHPEFARKCFTIALAFGTASALAMMLSGHTQAKKLATTQPAKLAAFEGHFHTGTGPTGMYLFGVPSPEEKRVKFGVQIPWMLSFLCYWDEFKPVSSLTSLEWKKPVPGLDKFRPEDTPPVVLPFLTYHVMVALAMVMLGLLLLAAYYRWRGTLFEKRRLMWAFVFAVVAPILANQTGWVSAEVGRQPFIVYGDVNRHADGSFTIDGGLRTHDAHSPNVPGYQVATSIGMFGFVYVLLFCVWVFVLNGKLQHGPDPVGAAPAETTAGGLLDAAARRGSPSPYTLTEGKQ